MAQKRRRDRYEHVGPAMREAIAWAEGANLGRAEWRVFGAVLALTAAWSKLQDRTSVEQIRGIARLSRRRTSDALNELDAAGVIAWEPTKSPLGTSLVRIAGFARLDTRDPRRSHYSGTPGVTQHRNPGGDASEKYSEEVPETLTESEVVDLPSDNDFPF